MYIELVFDEVDGDIIIDKEYYNAKEEQCKYSPAQNSPFAITSILAWWVFTTNNVQKLASWKGTKHMHMYLVNNCVPYFKYHKSKLYVERCFMNDVSDLLTVKQVFKDLDFLGWYTTGGPPDVLDIKIHKQVRTDSR